MGLGAVAVMISANVEGTNIGELSLDALWAKAEQPKLPVLIHPVLAGPAPRAAKFGLAQSTQYTFDTTLGVGSSVVFRSARPFSAAYIGALAWRRRVSLSRRTVRYHACADGSCRQGDVAQKAALRVRADDGL